MAVPDFSNVVRQIFADGSFNLTSHDGCGEFCEAVVRKLYSLDANFGHLKKRPEQNNYNGHAIDATLYKANGQTVDFVFDGGGSDARVSWSVKESDNYPADMWYAPTGTQPHPEPVEDGNVSADFENNVNAAMGRIELALGTVRVTDGVGEAIPTEQTHVLMRTGWLLDKDNKILAAIAKQTADNTKIINQIKSDLPAMVAKAIVAALPAILAAQTKK